MVKNKLSIEDIQKAVTPVAEKYGVKRVFLFGSYARGDNSDDSDIDLRIDKGKIRTLWDLSAFHLDIGDELNARVDVATTTGLSKEFLDRIRGEEVLLYEQ